MSAYVTSNSNSYNNRISGQFISEKLTDKIVYHVSSLTDSVTPILAFSAVSPSNEIADVMTGVQ